MNAFIESTGRWFAGFLVLLLAVAPPGGPANSQAPGEWGKRAPLLEANSEMAVVELDGKIYVIGGYPSTRVTVRTVQVYDPATDSWKIVTPLPRPANHLVSAAVGGKIYAIGGQAKAGGRGARAEFLDAVFEYSPAKDIWSPRAPMPTARSGGASAVIDGMIYVAGGRPPRGHDFAVYDPDRDTWTVLPDMPTQRNHIAMGAMGGKVYVFGGRLGPSFRDDMTPVVEIYDPAARTWTTGAPMPTRRGGINGIAAKGCFHVFGGEGTVPGFRGVFPQHEIYDPTQDRWHTRPPMPTPVHGVTGLAFINGFIHLPGGGTAIGGSSGNSIHQVYRPAMTCR